MPHFVCRYLWVDSTSVCSDCQTNTITPGHAAAPRKVLLHLLHLIDMISVSVLLLVMTAKLKNYLQLFVDILHLPVFRMNLLLLISLAVWSAAITSTTTLADNPLTFKSFALRSIVSHDATTYMRLRFTLDERYSYEQSRAIIHYKSEGRKEWTETFKENNTLIDYDAATWFYDDSMGLSLLQGYGTTSCIEIKWQSMVQMMGLDYLQYIKLYSHDHLVGPARLMYYVLDNNRHLRLEPEHRIKFIRNVPVVAYTLDLKPTDANDESVPAGGVDIKMYVYFDEYSQAQDRDNSVPMRITLQYRANTATHIDYSAVQVLDGSAEERNLLRQQHKGNANRNDQVLYDRFILDPLGGCTSFLLAARGHDLFFNQMEDDKKAHRFSFSALVDYTRRSAKYPSQSQDQQFELQVNYDGQLGMLRLDHTGETSNHLQNVRQVFNFHKNRVYNILHRDSSNNFMLRHLLDLSSTEGAEQNSQMPQSELSQCVIATIDRLNAGRKYRLDELLVGTNKDKKYLYLGKAHVRGINCLVFEATNTLPPFWLDQHVDFKTGTSYAATFSQRQPDFVSTGPPEEQQSQLKTLVYLNENKMNDKLVMIEIYRTDSSGVTIFEKWTLMVRDFVWRLSDQTSIDDERPAYEMFSLEQHCAQHPVGLNYRQDNQSQVELMVETKPLAEVHRLPDQLIGPLNERNLATLNALQKSLALSANMIFDLETKLIDRRTSSPPTRRLQMLISFRSASQAPVFVDPVYVGKGKRQLGQSWFFQVHSFQACYMLAAHRRVDVHFGFDSRFKYCFISTKAIIEPEEDKISTKKQSEVLGFTIDEHEGDLEIYRTEHFRLEGRWTSSDSWTKQESYEGDRVRLIDTWLVLEDANGSNNLEFEVKRVHVSRREPRVAAADDQTMLANSSNVDKLQGFGLVDGERVQAAPVHALHLNPFDASDYQDGQVTFEQCQAVCLADPKCESYSVCVKGAEIVCKLSKVSFKSAAFVGSIFEAAKTTKRGVEFQVTHGDTTVRLVKHLNCAIHNKRQMDFFKPEPHGVDSTLFSTKLQPVSGLEQCAQICAKRNLAALGAHINQVAGTMSVLGSEVIESSSIDPQLLTSIRHFDLNQALLQQVCFKFLYLDKFGLTKTLQSKLREYSDKYRKPEDVFVDNDEDQQGYCGIPMRLNKEQLPMDGIHQSLRFDQYDFRMDIFFEQQYGLSLRESPKTDKEAETYQMAKGGTSLDAKSINVLRSFLKRGDNSQVKQVGDKSTCALLCIMQALGPWPSCKSYDVLVDKNKEGTSTLYCLLNSITLSQAISQNRLDLINNQTALPGQHWHYEPRKGFALEASILEGDVQLWSRLHDQYLNSTGKTYLFIGTILTISLVSGYLIGTTIYEYIRPLSLLNYINDRRESRMSQVNVLADSQVHPLDSFEVEEITN